MSGTTEDTDLPASGGGVSPPEAQEAPPEPPRETPASREAADEDPVERRIARLTARLSTAARERDEFAARLAALEARQQAPQGQPHSDPQIEQFIEERATEKSRQELAKKRIRDFHAAGQAAHADWQQRCQDLQAFGADAQFAELLVDMPDGPKVAAALASDPEAVERIAGLRGERARAVALGQYAERLAAQPARNVSKAPPPPPKVTGRAAPAFNEYTANTDQLLQHYSKQAMERRSNGQGH